MNKTALSGDDDKRIVGVDCRQTMAYGHYKEASWKLARPAYKDRDSSVKVWVF